MRLICSPNLRVTAFHRTLAEMLYCTAIVVVDAETLELDDGILVVAGVELGPGSAVFPAVDLPDIEPEVACAVDAEELEIKYSKILAPASTP